MIYLVSGTSRSGKTIIANKILEEKRIPYISLDWLVMGFTNGVPELGIHDKLFPDEIAIKFWKFLKATCESIIWSGVDYVIEGEAILPELVSELLDEHPGKIKICFVGYPNISAVDKVIDVKKYNQGENDWLTNESDKYINTHIKNMINYSRKIMSDCKKFNLKYFDTSKDFNSSINKAVKYLLGNIDGTTS